MSRLSRFLFTVLFCGTSFAQTARSPLEEMTEQRATPEPLPFGPALMRQVRDNLPPMPLRLTGEVRTRSGKDRTTHSLISELRFGNTPATAAFALADAFGTPIADYRVTWQDHTPVWTQNGTPLASPTDLAGTGLQGADLALSFLWWPGAEVTGIQRIRARDAYEVRIPSPDGSGAVRMWIDKRALFVVEAELLDKEEDVLRRVEVDRLKKIREDLWMVQDLVVRDFENDRTINIRFSEVEELDP